MEHENAGMFDVADAERLGAFVEDAISEADARASGADLAETPREALPAEVLSTDVMPNDALPTRVRLR